MPSTRLSSNRLSRSSFAFQGSQRFSSFYIWWLHQSINCFENIARTQATFIEGKVEIYAKCIRPKAKRFNFSYLNFLIWLGLCCSMRANEQSQLFPLEFARKCWTIPPQSAEISKSWRKRKLDQKLVLSIFLRWFYRIWAKS